MMMRLEDGVYDNVTMINKIVHLIGGEAKYVFSL